MVISIHSRVNSFTWSFADRWCSQCDRCVCSLPKYASCRRSKYGWTFGSPPPEIPFFSSTVPVPVRPILVGSRVTVCFLIQEILSDPTPVTLSFLFIRPFLPGGPVLVLDSGLRESLETGGST